MWHWAVRACVYVLWWQFMGISWLEMGKHLNSLRYVRGIERPGIFQHWSIKDKVQVSKDIYTKKDSLSAHLELSRQQAKELSCPPMLLTFLWGFGVGAPPWMVWWSVYSPIHSTVHTEPHCLRCPWRKWPLFTLFGSLSYTEDTQDKCVSLLKGQNKTNFPTLVSHLNSQNLLHLSSFLEFMNW